MILISQNLSLAVTEPSFHFTVEELIQRNDLPVTKNYSIWAVETIEPRLS
ncbi:hypothetical protein LEMLEM_LOCUS5601 [Lemmus lemmus]